MLLTEHQREEMQIEDDVDGDCLALDQGQLLPPELPALAQVDLHALAAQLPDLSNLDNITVNIQANHFTPPPENTQQLHALAVDTEQRLGHLRMELKASLDKGNASITERFQMIGGWC
jgi:hypothetical protein